MGQKNEKKRANLRDVAHRAGVSVATVSRVMNAPQTVSDSTRQRVEQAMEALKYVPSAAARAINTGRSRFVGALVPTLDNAIFARFLDSLEAQLSQHQLSLVVATTDEDPKVEAEKAKNLADIGAEGLIISGLAHEPSLFELIERHQMPAVASSCYAPDFPLPTIGYDNARAAQLALGHLTALGHRQIAVVHGPVRHNDRTRMRLAGLREAQGAANLRFVEAPLSVAGGREAMATVAGEQADCRAVLCLSDVLASGVLFECNHRRIAVPEQLSLIGIDDLPGSRHLYPALTSVHLPVQRMGVAVADALAAWLQEEIKPVSTCIDLGLVVRDSCQKLPS